VLQQGYPSYKDSVNVKKMNNVAIQLVGVTVLFLVFSQAIHAQILFQDDFETGNLSNTQNGFVWTPTTNPAIVDFQGSKVARFRFVASPAGQDAWSEMRFTLGNYYRDVWLQYDLYVPTGYVQRAPGGDKSFVHLWTDSYSAVNGVGGGFTSWSETSPYLDRVLSFNQYEPQNVHVYDETRNRPQAIDNSMIGRWTQITINVRAGSGASDGVARIWKDGVLAFDMSAANHPSWYDMTRFLYVAGRNNQFNNGYIFGWSNSGYDIETYLYIDNFKFSTTPFGPVDPPNPPTLQ
jgi:hypothetical protein